MDQPGEVNDGRQEAARDSVGSGPERVGRAGTGRAETGSAETGSAETGSAETGSAETGTDAADAGAGTADAGESTTKTRRPGRLRRHPVLAVVVAAVITAVLILGAANIWVRAAASSHSYRTADAPSAPVALVLVAGLRVDGSPSQYLQDRLDDAITLYRAGKVRALLVSGDNGSLNHDEPTAMMTYLVAQDIPASQVIRDYAGFDTYDSCVRAKKIFGVTRALVVTQEFHLPRAVFLCRQAGIAADGVADPRPSGVRPEFVLREIPGSVKAAWDAIWQPDPKYLGPAEPALRVAAGG